jgi:sialate O-acetylesterase
MKLSSYLYVVIIVMTAMSCDSGHQVQNEALRLAGLFGDSMVLQQQTEAAIWGWAEPGELVVISSSWGELSTTQAKQDGTWITHLVTPSASIGHRLEVIAGSDTLFINDVAIGEVWVASGQSNMEMPLSGWPDNPILDSEIEIASATNPDIRMIMLDRALYGQPIQQLNGQWLPATTRNASSMSATAYFFAKHLHTQLGVPIGVIHSSWGGTAVDSWIPVEELEKIGGYEQVRDLISEADTLTQYTPTVLFNAMIHPLIPFTIKGFIWYQGESDAGNPSAYKEKFTTMIRTWRERWGQGEVPFYFVQIAPYDYGQETASQKLREAQLESLSVTNTGMVVTLDIGDPTNIHPANKQEVGRRLALWAAGHAYNKELVYSGPIYESMGTIGNELIISFKHFANRLVAGPDGVQSLMIAGIDQIFYPARVILEPNRIRVSHPAVSKPVAVRYAWDNITSASLFNSAGLPASSFRTDRWN